jgi:cephalosporin hydroxylase
MYTREQFEKMRIEMVKKMAADKSFKVDKQIENKLLFTCNPCGYLMRN